jgi:hypothetical protein
MTESNPDELTRLMKELVKWAKLTGKQQLKMMILENLKTNTEKLVYELSDGERSVRDVEKKTKVSKSRVGSYWEKWLALGIVEESERFQGRMRHICSLDELGIEVTKSAQETPSIEAAQVTLSPDELPRAGRAVSQPGNTGESQ